MRGIDGFLEEVVMVDLSTRPLADVVRRSQTNANCRDLVDGVVLRGVAHAAPGLRIGTTGTFIIIRIRAHVIQGGTNCSRPWQLPVVLLFCNLCLEQNSGLTGTDLPGRPAKCVTGPRRQLLRWGVHDDLAGLGTARRRRPDRHCLPTPQLPKRVTS